jgi:hypothetical protein
MLFSFLTVCQAGRVFRVVGILFQTGFRAIPFLEHFSVCLLFVFLFVCFFDCWCFASLLGETSYISVALFLGFLWLMV